MIKIYEYHDYNKNPDYLKENQFLCCPKTGLYLIKGGSCFTGIGKHTEINGYYHWYYQNEFKIHYAVYLNGKVDFNTSSEKEAIKYLKELVFK